MMMLLRWVLISLTLVAAAAATRVSEEWVIKLAPSITPQEYEAEHKGAVQYVKSVAGGAYHVFRSDHDLSSSSFHHVRRGARDEKMIEWAEKQVPRKQYTRTSDPYYNVQWHLHGPHSIDVQEGAWNHGVEGQGVVIGVVDDGLQHRHPDLMQNYRSDLSHNFNGGPSRSDPSPAPGDGHGTAAAGVAGAAENNGVCGTGVAPRVGLAGIRLIAEGVYDYVEADGLSWQSAHIPIYSCSWGPYDSGADLQGPGRVVKEALRRNYHDHGTVYVWAAGNGRQHSDNVNYDGYANSPYTIAIGALDHAGNQAYYSESGACLFAVAPSSGAGVGITTTDLVGHDGYSAGQCTHQFGGTSSAAPLAAGIAALLKQRYPRFGAREIMHTFAHGATPVNLHDPDWSPPTAGHGIRHSHHYGFGLLKVPGLMRAAQLIHDHPLPPQRTLDSGWKRVSGSSTRLVRVPVPGGPLSYVEQVIVHLQWSHPSTERGRTGIDLISPATGVISHLYLPHSADTHMGTSAWEFTSVRHWGEAHHADGQWRVQLTGREVQQGVTITGVRVELIGY